MSTATKNPEELKEYEEQFIDEVWNAGEFDFLEETVSDDYVGHWFDLDQETVDKAGLRDFIEEARAGFSDFEMTPEFMLVEDDMITVGFTTSGTHDGEFMDIPPTGEAGNTTGIFVHRFDDDGMMTEAWASWDALGMLQQLGVVPKSFTLASFLDTGAHLAKQDILKLTKRD
jgi:steroid delta-isomerase-like uncharacterized protein